MSDFAATSIWTKVEYGPIFFVGFKNKFRAIKAILKGVIWIRKEGLQIASKHAIDSLQILNLKKSNLDQIKNVMAQEFKRGFNAED